MIRGESDSSHLTRWFSLTSWNAFVSFGAVCLFISQLCGCRPSSDNPSNDTTANPSAEQSTSRLSQSSSSNEGSVAGGSESPGFVFQSIESESIQQSMVKNGAKGEFALPETIGSGIAMFDYDQDGRVDVCVAGGGVCDVVNKQVTGHKGSLLKTVSQWDFKQVGEWACLDFSSTNNVGVFSSDFNEDGWADLLITGYRGLQLFRNQGDGTFEFVTNESKLIDKDWSTGAAFFDADGDSDLDLYVVHYGNWSLENHPLCPSHYKATAPDYCGPREYAGVPDLFFENLGDGTFREFPDFAPPNIAMRGLGVIAADLDGDRDVDVYVANDVDPNLLFRNDGKLKFSEVGVRCGVAFDDQGRPEGSMGIALGDYNLDGKFDLWVTNYQNELCALYRGVGKLSFSYASRATKIGATDELSVSWGTAFHDFDVDGDEDLFIVNGHIESYSPGSPFAQKAQLLENDSGKWFRLTRGSPSDFRSQQKPARGLALGDLDRDGDLDFAVTNLNEPISMVQNRCERKGAPCLIRLRGTASNRDAIGATVVMEVGDKRMVRQVVGGGSFASTNDRVLHFGVPAAQATTKGKLTIQWPSGRDESILDFEPTEQEWLIVEGEQ